MLDGFPTRAAWALCTFAYSAGPSTEPILFEGRTDGKIVPARGPPNFGWDPVFEAENTGLTYVFHLPLHHAGRPTSRANGGKRGRDYVLHAFL
jgi:inosine triphosphate pyrophosphatase